jgi:hypothetical protein
MKKIAFSAVALLFATGILAQTISVGTGKKLQVVSTIKLNTTVSQMGSEMEIPATSDIYTDFEIKSITGKSIVLIGTLKRVVGKTSMMGNDQSYDSDDPSFANNPLMAEGLKELNKPNDITIELGKTKLPSDITGAQSSSDIANYLFIPVNAATVKTGFSWSDSSASPEGSKAVNNYTVTKVSKEEIAVTVINTNKTIATRQQMGMEVKVNMEGASSATLIYDAASGVLKSFSSSFSSSGNNEAMGQSIPVTLKGAAAITVK